MTAIHRGRLPFPKVNPRRNPKGGRFSARVYRGSMGGHDRKEEGDRERGGERSLYKGELIVSKTARTVINVTSNTRYPSS